MKIYKSKLSPETINLIKIYKALLRKLKKQGFQDEVRKLSTKNQRIIPKIAKKTKQNEQSYQKYLKAQIKIARAYLSKSPQIFQQVYLVKRDGDFYGGVLDLGDTAYSLEQFNHTSQISKLVLDETSLEVLDEIFESDCGYEV